MATSNLNSTFTLPVSKGLSIGRAANSWPEYLYRLLTDDIDHAASRTFLDHRWLISVYFSVAYMILVYLGLKWMKNRAPYNLRIPLSVWSGALAVFSLFGTIAVWPEFLELAWNKGFVATYCDNSYRENRKLMFWYTIFVLSKLAELFDTAFIVLRKQRLITLHWVHHVLTLIYCFYVYRDQVSTARWMVSMNFLIHTLMYAYYSLKALRVNISRVVALMITSGQIVQMCFGFYINAHTLVSALSPTNTCQCSLRASISGFMLYALFFYYFVRFFVDSYLSKSKPLHSKDLKVLKDTKQHQAVSNGKSNGAIHDLNNNDMNLLPKKTN